MPLQTAFQRAHKSGGCREYEERYGHQEDERAFNRSAYSMGDLRAAHRMKRRVDAMRMINARADANAARAKRANSNRAISSESKPSMLQRAASKVRGLIAKAKAAVGK